MLKKVSLVVVALLVTASLANADLVFTLNGNPAADMQVSPGAVLNFSLSSTTDSSLSYIDVVPGTGSFVAGSATAGAALGDMGSILGPSDIGAGTMEYTITQAWSADGIAGLLATGTITVNGGPVVIQLWDNAIGFNEPAGQWTVTTIPEPATMALLGLGGLLLRKRK